MIALLLSSIKGGLHVLDLYLLDCVGEVVFSPIVHALLEDGALLLFEHLAMV